MGQKRAKKGHQRNEAKKIANSKQGPFRVAIWHACEPAVETPEWVGLYSSRKGFGLCIKFETPCNSVAVKYSKRPDMGSEECSHVVWYSWHGVVYWSDVYIGLTGSCGSCLPLPSKRPWLVFPWTEPWFLLLGYQQALPAHCIRWWCEK